MGSILSLLRPDDNQSDMPGSFVPPRRVPTEAAEGNSLEPHSRIYPSLVGLTDMRTLENDFRTFEPSSRRHWTSHREGGYDDDSMMLIESTTALRPSSSSERRISREEHDYEMADDETMMLTERMRNLQTSSSPASTSSTPESLKRKSPPSHLVTPTKRQKQSNAPRIGRSHSISPPKARKAKACVSLPVNSGSRYSPIEVDEDEGTEEHRESSDVDMDQNPDESVNPQNDIQLEDILESCLREPAVTIPPSSEYTVPGLSSSITLRDHQISGVMWMRDRENSRAKGGILADEMGLGKTLQTFCIIAEDVKKPSSTRHMPTLITSPIAILPQWKSELRRYESTDLKLGIVVYHGKERKDITMHRLLNANVILTTYGTLTSEWKIFNSLSSKPKLSDYWVGDIPTRLSTTEKPLGALFTIDLKFRRVIFDEADQFRNPDTQLAEAIFALKAEKFWMLTGTPIHNSLRDLHPFLRILKIKPMLDYQWYTEKVINPIAGGSASSRGRAYQRLHIVLSRVMLRRRKNDMLNGKKLLDLQEMDTNLVYCELDPFEREIYEALQSRFDSILGRLLSQAAEKRNKRLYTCFWVLLLRLRQACLHPSLIIKDYTPEEHEMHEVAEQEGVREERSETEGRIDRCILCGLLFTGSNVDANQYKILCGEVMELTRQKLSQHTSGSMVESSKIRMILHILEDIHQRSPKEKTIIYSQFTNMLDVVAKFLEGRYNFVFYHGKLNASQRETVLREIKTKSKVTVMLVSLKAGGSGLNLAECNNVILADLWWNPAVEEQAFGRVHRIGQEKKVHIYKLVAANTVEGRILNMQARKQELANTALDSDEIKQVAKLSREEIVELLSDKSENELKTLASHA